MIPTFCPERMDEWSATYQDMESGQGERESKDFQEKNQNDAG